MKKNLQDVAKVIRSKNAGPFELTLDILFKDISYYNYFKEKKIINLDLISKLYKTPKKNILNIVYFDPSNAIKITMKRWIPSGSIGESDIYGAQQHAPLLLIQFDYS